MSVVTEPQEVSMVAKPPQGGLAARATVHRPPGAVKFAVIVRSLSMTTLMVMLSAEPASTSPDHLSNWYPSEQTAVSVTTVPFAYVCSAHSGGLIVTLPAHWGLLTTVSSQVPQAQVRAGGDNGVRSTAAVIRIADNQNSGVSLIGLISLPTSLSYWSQSRKSSLQAHAPDCHLPSVSKLRLGWSLNTL